MTPHPRWKAYVLSASVASEFNWIFAASPALVGRGPPIPKSECYIVRDANGHALAYVYFEDEPVPAIKRATSVIASLRSLAT